MYPGAPNPIQIQSVQPDKGKDGRPPLILIHDSSGTTFGYFALGDLDRDVWAIHDPNYWEITTSKLGVDDLASHYIQLIENAGILGPVILGGWSFGGFVAIAMARLLAAATTSISTVGLLLIDSGYVLSPNHIDPRLLNTIELDTLPAPLKNVPDLALQSMARADQMLESWNLPTWEREVAENNCRSTSQPSIHDKELEKGQMTCFEQDKHIENRASGFKSAYAPPAVLVRCKQFVDNKENTTKLCLVDIYRHEKLLGWETGHPGFIKAVVEVDADHYNIFDANDVPKMESLTVSLKESLASF